MNRPSVRNTPDDRKCLSGRNDIPFSHFDAFSGNLPDGSSFSETASLLRKFGYSDLLIISQDTARLKEKIRAIVSEGVPLSFRTCAEIRVPDAGKLIGKVSSARNNADFVLVRSSDEKVMRAAVDSPKVDILIPYENGRTGMINQIVAKAAADNDVAFAFEISPLINSRGYRRARYIAGISEMVPILRKYNVPILLISGAGNFYDFRDAFVQEAIGQLFTLTPEECRKACSDNYLKMIRLADMKKEGRYLGNGIEITEPETTVPGTETPGSSGLSGKQMTETSEPSSGTDPDAEE